MLDESVKKEFSIFNNSNFSIDFSIKTLLNGIQNIKGSQAFSFIPSEATIQPQQTFPVTVIFQPDRISEKFFTLISIDIPFQKVEKRIFIYSSCFPR